MAAEKNFENKIKDFLKGQKRYAFRRDGTIYDSKFDRLVSQTVNVKTGYLQCSLVNGVGHRNYFVVNTHKIITMIFIPNPSNYPTVNHKDGNKLNNSIGNLEWCTYSKNIQHSYDNNLHKRNRPVQQYLGNKLIGEFNSAHEADRMTNSNPSHIGECCKGQLKSHNGFIWKFKEVIN